jgi:putative transposase
VEQIMAVLKQAELGVSVADLIRQVGISEQTFYRRKKQHAGLESSQVRELKVLQDESARLKQLVAELSLDKAILQDINQKKMARPALKRQVVDYIVSHHGTSERRACRLVKQHRSVQSYCSSKDPQLALRARLRELAQARIRYGCRRLQVLLRREGWAVGKKRVYRLYCEEALPLRSKLPRRRRRVVTRRERYAPTRPGQAWSLDFVADQLVNGQRFRILTVVDVFTREALAVKKGLYEVHIGAETGGQVIISKA